MHQPSACPGRGELLTTNSAFWTCSLLAKHEVAGFPLPSASHWGKSLQPRGQVTTREHSTHLTKGCHPSHVGWGWKGDYLVWPNSLVVPKCPQTSSYWGQHLSLTNIEEYQTVIYFDCSQMHPRVPSPSTPTWFLVQAQDAAWSWPPKQMHVGFSCPIQIFSEIPQMQPNLSVNES